MFAPLHEHPERSGLFSDFDGTLAPIVDDPAAARPLPGVADALAVLARRLGRVGVISGRPASFLQQHLGGRGLQLWGLYGLERIDEQHGGVAASPGVETWRDVVAAVADRARRDVGDVLGVENKQGSLTLHFRTAPDKEGLARSWAQRAAEETGLVPHEARKSVELRPPVPHGKGAVLESAAKDLSAVSFIGDDIGDLDAFDALDRLAAARGVSPMRVAVRSDESPPELLSRADLVVDGPEGVLALLQELAASN